jgi:single-stranded DNA-specific DHH superfamily exonuclease
MLNSLQAAFIRDELMTAKNPLFIHDDDPDGLCSFLLLYRQRKEGKGAILNSAPKLDERFLRKVEEVNPDKIFVLDIPIVEQEFIDKVNRPIFWLDHHQPLERHNIHYFNPRIKDPHAYYPTTAMAYQITQNPEDLWIAMVGCLADWYLPNFVEQFKEKYPDLLQETGDLTKLVYHQPIGQLVKLFFFILKGPTQDVRKSIKILTRIQSPEEITKQETAQGKFLWKRFKQINHHYEILLKEAKKQVNRSNILLFFYLDNQWSFTPNLANELTSLYPKKVIVIGRKKSGSVKCSLRAQFPILESVEKALIGIEGYGGGHYNACGAVVKEDDWDRFFDNFKRELKSIEKEEAKEQTT